MSSFFGPFPKTMFAYSKDASGNEYFGEAAKGTTVNKAGWQIFCQQYTGVNWVSMFPIDSATGKASAEPKFVWSSATTGAYTYQELGS